MYTTISEDRKVVLDEIQKTLGEVLILIKQETQELSLSLLIQLKALTLQFLLSYKEYSLANIKEFGLGEILLMRALRFFKLDLRDPENERKFVKKLKKTKKGVKRTIKRIGKVILFPLYLILLLMDGMRIKDRHPKNKINKYVKNSYHE